MLSRFERLLLVRNVAGGFHHRIVISSVRAFAVGSVVLSCGSGTAHTAAEAGFPCVSCKHKFTIGTGGRDATTPLQKHGLQILTCDFL